MIKRIKAFKDLKLGMFVHFGLVDNGAELTNTK